MDLVVFGQQNWDVCWTAKQHLATGLAARGHRVLYVDPTSVPVRGARELAAALRPVPGRSGVREEGPNGLAVYSYRSVPELGDRVNAGRRTRLLRDTLHARGFHQPVVLALHPRTVELLPLVQPSASAYYAVDEWTGFYDDQPQLARQIRALEERMLREVDVAIGVSPRLHERFAASHPHAVLLPNAVDARLFAPERLRTLAGHSGMRALPRPRLTLIGQLDRRVDQALLLALAQRNPAWQIVSVGRVKDVDTLALAQQPNVHLLGYHPFEALPSILRETDVCLVPYRLTELAHACSPLKAYEYLATGLPVVATPVEGLRPLADVVQLADGIDAFERAVRAALTDPAAGRDRRLATAAENSWALRVDELERLLLGAVEQRRRQATRTRTAVPGTAPRAAARPLLDLKEDAEQRRRGHFADQRLTPKAELLRRALRVAGRGYHWARMVGRRLRGERPARVRRILVVRRGYLGDLVVFMPTLAALRARYPHAHITLGVHGRFSAGALLEHSSYVDDVRVLDFLHEPTTGARLRGALRLFAAGYDLVLFGVWYFLIPEGFFAGAPYQIGLDDGHPLQVELDQRVPLQPYRHEADNNLALAERLGAQPTGVERVPLLPPSGEREVARAESLLARLRVPDDATIVVMHPGSKRPSRRWPAESFAALATALLHAHPTLRIVLTGTGDEQELVARIGGAVPAALRARLHSAAGQCDLGELVALLECAAVLVSNDTGVMHVARARGIPLVALLGPENDRRWGPHAFGPAPAISLRQVVPCAPCPRNQCEHLYCLRSLDVGQVRAAVEELLRGRPAPDGAGHPAPARVAPPAGDVELVPLQRRHRRQDWGELAAAGFELPLVSVLLFAPRLDDGAAPAMDAAGLRSLLARLDAQRYPRVELVIVVAGATAPGAPAAPGATPLPPAVVLADGDTTMERVAYATAMGEGAEWAAALHAAHGELLTPLGMADAALIDGWSADKLGNDVAALIRLPEAAQTSGPAPLADGAATAGGGEVAGGEVAGGMMRRTPLASALARLPAAERAARGAGAALLPHLRALLADQHPVVVPEAGRRAAAAAMPEPPAPPYDPAPARVEAVGSAHG